MTQDEALAAFRARWDHPWIDAADVLERVSIRFPDRHDGLQVRAISAGRGAVSINAVRLFIGWPPLVENPEKGEAGLWASAYVHRIADVDEVLDRLLARLPELAREHPRRAARAGYALPEAA